MKKRTIIASVIFLFLFYILENIISICAYSIRDERCEADVVIVLGAAAYDRGVSPVYRERLNHGICLYQQGLVKKIIVTGGVAKGNKHSDAYSAKEYVLSQGVPKEDILMEEASVITQENLENSKALMEKNGYQTAIVVSDPLHMKRAMLLAEDAGMKAYSSPTPTTMYRSLKTKLPFLTRELFYCVGYKWYRIFH
ncbi:MAG: YdcF family protein [Lachnospiraceae bacterium]|uniref:YdcF family protein n=1 Tax=Candidatus Merdisoma sp. JLR.KK011 TaxID=3114299 RepID=UPI002FF43E57|nr:YdcF family protein [Lachnospiraceae bacterium]